MEKESLPGDPFIIFFIAWLIWKGNKSSALNTFTISNVFSVYVILFFPAFSSFIKSLVVKANRSSGTSQRFTNKANPVLIRTQLEVCFFEGNPSDDLIKGDEKISKSSQDMLYCFSPKFY